MIKKLYDFQQVAIPAALLQAEVTREEMDAELQSAAARFTAIVPAEGPTQQGDVVKLSFADDKAEGGLRQIFANVGKGFEDVEELLPGRCAGEQLQFAYAGKEVAATIVSIKRLQIPALTDELVAQLGIPQVSTLAQMEAHVFAKLAEGQRKRKFRGIMGLVSKALMENTEFSPMEEDHPWYQALHGVMLGRIQAFADQMGQTLDEALPAALRMNDKPLEECRQALTTMCIERARTGALGQAYAQEKGVSFEEGDIASQISKYADYLNQVVYEHFAPMIEVAHP